MATSSSSTSDQVIRRSNPRTVLNKFLVQYNATYTCPGDGRPVPGSLTGWNAWFHNANGILNPSFDLWPDTSEYTQPETFQTPQLKLADGQQATLFSSRHPKTILRHFNLMAKHGVDGAFLRRIAADMETEGSFSGTKAELTKWRDDVGQLVIHAAEREGRSLAIMYDVQGVPYDRFIHTLCYDWRHLVRDQAVLDSFSYLHEENRPVLMIKGVAYHDPAFDLEILRQAIRQLRTITPGGLYLILSVPALWRSVNPQNPQELSKLQSLIQTDIDAICPRHLGRYGDAQSTDEFFDQVVKQDVEYLRGLYERTNKNVDYIPGVWPGYSVYNISHGKESINTIKRDGGKFLWRQVWHAKRNGCRTVLGMSWDGYDDGTAMLPVVSTKRLLPTRGAFMALDADGADLPADWYMRVCGMAAEGLRDDMRVQETFPVKELQDYWSSRPKYESALIAQTKQQEAQGQASGSGASGSGAASGSAVPIDHTTAWKDKVEDLGDEPPPPPYSLEADELAMAAAAAAPMAIGVPTPAVAQVPVGQSVTSPASNGAGAGQAGYFPPQPVQGQVAPAAQQIQAPGQYAPQTVASPGANLPGRVGSISGLTGAFAQTSLGASQPQNVMPAAPAPATSQTWPPPEWGVQPASSTPQSFTPPIVTTPPQQMASLPATGMAYPAHHMPHHQASLPLGPQSPPLQMQGHPGYGIGPGPMPHHQGTLPSGAPLAQAQQGQGQWATYHPQPTHQSSLSPGIGSPYQSVMGGSPHYTPPVSPGPQAFGQAGQGATAPISGTATPPPPPQRPSASTASSSGSAAPGPPSDQQSSGFSLAGSNSSTINMARGYLDRLAGEDRRKAIEKTADGAIKTADVLLKSGSKYFSKFSK